LLKGFDLQIYRVVTQENKVSVNDKQDPSKEQEDPIQPDGVSAEKKFVSVTAYKEVSSDMHKYKQRARDAEAKANELAERIKSSEENELKAKQEYQTLYEREKAEKERVIEERGREKDLYLRSVKLSALKDELGGKVKDEYLSFARIEKIEFKEDGTLNSESVQTVANTFRQDHPGLIAKDSSVNITGANPAKGVQPGQPPKGVNDLTTAEKIALLEKLKQNRS